MPACSKIFPFQLVNASKNLDLPTMHTFGAILAAISYHSMNSIEVQTYILQGRYDQFGHWIAI